MPVHNCPNYPYTSHQPFDLRRHLRRKAPCNGINENTQTGMVVMTNIENTELCTPIYGSSEPKDGVPAPIDGVVASKNEVPAPIDGVVSSTDEPIASKIECNKCEKCFFNKPSLIRHRKVCRGLRSDICKICLKQFANTAGRALHNRRVKCKVPSIPIPKINPVDNITESSSNPNEFIYLIQLREFVRNNEPIYKIGRTKQSYEKRIKSYPRGSSLLFYHTVDDCVTTETNIKKYLGENFIQRRDLGLEYFEGDCKLIMNAIKQFL